MDKTNIKELVNYSQEGPSKKVFYDKEDIKAQVVCLKSRQVIPWCKMNNDMLFYIIEGEGEIFVDNEKEKLYPGISVVVLKQAESRSISARTNMVILAVQAKDKKWQIKQWDLLAQIGLPEYL